ncbi:MAG: DUF952 domain-containing protein [Flavobacteriaceae bacterium]
MPRAADKSTIYKVLRAPEWQSARAAGRFSGSSDDRRDGFIHFSTAEQLPGTLERHFAGERDLELLAVPARALGDALRWETSRGGALFPHLYGDLDLTHIAWRASLPMGSAGPLPERLA